MDSALREDEPAVALLCFELEDQRFAVPIERVSEVQRAVTLLPLPGAPAIIEGVIDLRGEMVVVAPARARFGLPVRPLVLSDHLLIVRTSQRLVALRVDRVTQQVMMPAKQLREAGRQLPTLDYVAGVARIDGDLHLIHDPDRFLSELEHRSLDSVL